LLLQRETRNLQSEKAQKIVSDCMVGDYSRMKNLHGLPVCAFLGFHSAVCWGRTEVHMFRSFSGSRAQYGDLTLLVVAEFNEWKVLVHGPGVAILGIRQFDGAKARAHAVEIAEAYLRERRGQEPPPADDVVWTPTDHDDWLVWHGTTVAAH
jgi:hypothetical protein